MNSKEKARESNLKRKFNLTIQDYDKILELQGKKCFICGKLPTNKNLAVDHEHKSGLIRGLLCMRCNRALTPFKDDPVLLRRAVLYLENPPASNALEKPRYGLKGRSNSKKKTLIKNNPEWFKDGKRIYPPEVLDQEIK
jgi:recombination endonuclease VII